MLVLATLAAECQIDWGVSVGGASRLAAGRPVRMLLVTQARDMPGLCRLCLLLQIFSLEAFRMCFNSSFCRRNQGSERFT